MPPASRAVHPESMAQFFRTILVRRGPAFRKCLISWRSLRDSNPCYSLERVANSANHPLIHRVVAKRCRYPQPWFPSRMNAVDRTIIKSLREARRVVVPDWRRSVRRERCADVPRQADRPVGTLRCRSTRDAVSISTRSCPGVGWYEWRRATVLACSAQRWASGARRHGRACTALPPHHAERR